MPDGETLDTYMGSQSQEVTLEPIRGQQSSSYWASDREVVYTAALLMRFRCGRCGQFLVDDDEWPRRCPIGHLNTYKQ